MNCLFPCLNNIIMHRQQCTHAQFFSICPTVGGGGGSNSHLVSCGTWEMITKVKTLLNTVYFITEKSIIQSFFSNWACNECTWQMTQCPCRSSLTSSASSSANCIPQLMTPCLGTSFQKFPFLEYKVKCVLRHKDGWIQLHCLCGCVWLLLQLCMVAFAAVCGGFIAYTHAVSEIGMHRHTRCNWEQYTGVDAVHESCPQRTSMWKIVICNMCIMMTEIFWEKRFLFKKV